MWRWHLLEIQDDIGENVEGKGCKLTQPTMGNNNTEVLNKLTLGPPNEVSILFLYIRAEEVKLVCLSSICRSIFTAAYFLLWKQDTVLMNKLITKIGWVSKTECHIAF